MRRPLDWILSLSMVWLVVHVLTESDPSRVSAVPSDLSPHIGTSAEESPFAWIREDGSYDYLPATTMWGSGHPTAADAVFTWTLPVATPASELRSIP